MFEEQMADDREKAATVYEKIINLIPHEQFTFTKVWILYSKFLIRGQDLTKARRVLGMSLGKCPKVKIFKHYAELEFQLGEADRCRTIYEKFVSTFSMHSAAWVEYAEFEASLEEPERARAIYEIAINTEQMDQPEAVWKSYIDFETKNGDVERARALYETLL